jgi:nitroreductase
MKEIFERTSVRSYMTKRVEDEKIQALLKAAMAAPSAGNQQPWEIYVVKNKETIQSLAKVSPYAGCAAKAPVVLVPCYRSRDLLFPEYAQIDLSIACENILLEAVSQNLGAVWLGIAPIRERMEKTAEVLNLPDHLKAFALLPVGYPAKQEKPQNRFDLERIHVIV